MIIELISEVLKEKQIKESIRIALATEVRTHRNQIEDSMRIALETEVLKGNR